MPDAVEFPVDSEDPTKLFSIKEKLGEGAFGSVFRCTLKHTNHVFAVKKVFLGKIDSSLLQEINLLKECTHPNIVKFHGCYGPIDQELWILQELCEAGSLADCLKATQTTFSERQIAYIISNVLSGLEYLHSKRIIHRDIKAANILLTDDSKVKIADFGVSGTLSASISARNSLVGTPFWMGPEVILGSPYGTSADIWSLGITCIELAQGSVPLQHVAPMRAMLLIPYSDPPTLKRPTRHSAKFKSFIKDCLVSNPDHRPSCIELSGHSFLRDVDINTLKEKVDKVLALKASMQRTHIPQVDATIKEKFISMKSLAYLERQQVDQDSHSEFDQDSCFRLELSEAASDYDDTQQSSIHIDPAALGFHSTGSSVVVRDDGTIVPISRADQTIIHSAPSTPPIPPDEIYVELDQSLDEEDVASLDSESTVQPGAVLKSHDAGMDEMIAASIRPSSLIGNSQTPDEPTDSSVSRSRPAEERHEKLVEYAREVFQTIVADISRNPTTHVVYWALICLILALK